MLISTMLTLPDLPETSPDLSQDERDQERHVETTEPSLNTHMEAEESEETEDDEDLCDLQSVSDSESEAGSLSESEESDDEWDPRDTCDNPEITTEDDLARFSRIMFSLQVAAEEREKQARGKKRKTPWQYLGNSSKTKKRHVKKHDDLAAEGFLGIKEFLARRGQSKQRARDVPSQSSEPVAEAASEVRLACLITLKS